MRSIKEMRAVLVPALVLSRQHAVTEEDKQAVKMLERIIGDREILGGIAELLAKEGD